MKIAITVPVYHSDELLANFTRETLESIASKKHQISVYVIVNYSLPEYLPNRNSYKLNKSVSRFFVKENDENSVSRAWNAGIDWAVADKNDYVVVINNDILFQKNAIDNLVDFAGSHPEYILWTASEFGDLRRIRSLDDSELDETHDDHPHFSCFMVSRDTIDIVGGFDENLKMAYFEDSDYHYRILLAGKKAGKTNKAKFYHYGSRSINVDDNLFSKNKRSYEENRAYIKRKWGFDFHGKAFSPPEEMLKLGYLHPFNNKSKNLKDW